MLRKKLVPFNRKQNALAYDPWLLIALFALLFIGLTMVTSSSIVIGSKLHQQAFYYLIRQSIHLGLGIILALFVLKIPVVVWHELSPRLLLCLVVLLLLLLIPGMGREVNGAVRWLAIGPIRLQISEIAKLIMILYLASYIVRHQPHLQSAATMSFVSPLLVVALIVVLLLAEPDFGSSVVIFLTSLGMLFLSGVRLLPFIILTTSTLFAMFVLAIASPYRFARLTTFLNPWQYQFDTGYQLTQSLIAFGRGGLTGLGLGESIQKMFYLPEAHTDFLFAVVAEELGLCGALVILGLFYLLWFKMFLIARRALQQGEYFSGFVAYGFSFWIGIQTTVNVGVSSGLFPTKGLTLPLISYGGASMMIFCVLFAILFRIDYEIRQKNCL